MIPLHNEVFFFFLGGGGGGGGIYRFHSISLSVTSTVLDGFFPYWVQMITTMRSYVAHNDLYLQSHSGMTLQ